MKLYMLYSTGFSESFDFSVIVRARDEAEARRIADVASAKWKYEDHPWLSSVYSTCIELKATGSAGVVVTIPNDNHEPLGIYNNE